LNDGEDIQKNREKSKSKEGKNNKEEEEEEEEDLDDFEEGNTDKGNGKDDEKDLN